MSMVVICPSRGRPDKAKEAYAAFNVTKASDDTDIKFVIDADDKTYGDYVSLPFCMPVHAGGMGNALNAAAIDMVDVYDYIGFIGDDHRFRTYGWDEHIERTLNEAGGGIAYGNDLMQSINLPTQVFMSSSIVKALGWMALPGAKHLYLDDTWKSLGEGLDRLFYFPELIIEHMHPAAGKAEWDDNYKRVNDQSVYNHDLAVFIDWRDHQYVNDVAKARAALEHHGDGGGVE
jgi:hypothetical protein